MLDGCLQRERRGRGISRSMETSGEKWCAGYVPRARGQPSSRCPEICVTFCGRSCGRRGNTRPRPSSSATARGTRTLFLRRSSTDFAFLSPPRSPLSVPYRYFDRSIDRGFKISNRRYWKMIQRIFLLYKFVFVVLRKVWRFDSFSRYID